MIAEQKELLLRLSILLNKKLNDPQVMRENNILGDITRNDAWTAALNVVIGTILDLHNEKIKLPAIDESEKIIIECSRAQMI